MDRMEVSVEDWKFLMHAKSSAQCAIHGDFGEEPDEFVLMTLIADYLNSYGFKKSLMSEMIRKRFEDWCKRTHLEVE